MALNLDRPLSGKTIADLHQLETAVETSNSRDSFLRVADIAAYGATAKAGYEAVVGTGEAYAALGALGEGVVAGEVLAALSVAVAGAGVAGGLLLAVGVVGVVGALYNAATGGSQDESMEALGRFATLISPKSAAVYGAGYLIGGPKGGETATTLDEARKDFIEFLDALAHGEDGKVALAGLMLVKDMEKLTGIDVPGDSDLGPQKANDIPAEQIFGGNDYVPKSDPMADVPALGANIDRDENQDDNRDEDNRDDEDRGDRGEA